MKMMNVQIIVDFSKGLIYPVQPDCKNQMWEWCNNFSLLCNSNS